MSAAVKYKAIVADKYYISESEKYLLVHLELVNPSRIKFLAGQYVSIGVSEAGDRRSYSIANTPDITHAITLVAEMIPGGLGSEYLKNIQIGHEIEILGPMGRFVIQMNERVNEQTNNLLFVATGSGIVPIKSMIEDLLIVQKDQRQIRLHWGMRREEDLFWTDNFERLAEEYPNFVFDQVLSRPSESWSLCTGHVQDCLSRDFAEGMAGWEAYVCGSIEAVSSIEDKLVELKIPRDKIYTEKFV